jgi:hypothetical protein
MALGYAWMGMQVEVPMRIKLADVDKLSLHLSHMFPQGGTFDLIVGVPKSDLPPSFSGHASITESGQRVTEFDFDSSQVQECNWVRNPDLQGYILSWRQPPSTRLLKGLKSGHVHDIAIEFSKSPTSGSSVWLTWLQRGID